MNWIEIGPLLLGGTGSATAMAAVMVAATVQHRATMRERRARLDALELQAHRQEELARPDPVAVQRAQQEVRLAEEEAHAIHAAMASRPDGAEWRGRLEENSERLRAALAALRAAQRPSPRPAWGQQEILQANLVAVRQELDAAKYVHQLPQVARALDAHTAKPARRRPPAGTSLLARILWPLLVALAARRNARRLARFQSALGTWEPALLARPVRRSLPDGVKLEDWQAQVWDAAHPEDRHGPGADCSCTWAGGEPVRIETFGGELVRAYTSQVLEERDPACPRAARAAWFDQLASK